MSYEIEFTAASIEIPEMFFIHFIYSSSILPHIFIATVWTFKLVKVQSYIALIICHRSTLTIDTHKPKLRTEIFVYFSYNY